MLATASPDRPRPAPADAPKVRIGRSTRSVLAVILFASSAAAVARADDAPAAGPRTQKFDVGGHKLTLVTRGRGGPTVVIEPGMGLPAAESDEWKAVCDEVAKTNAVCLYDRAGLGTSDPAPTKPRTSRDVARDLHNLLANAKVPGPYVLVAHSFGGLHARVFAETYPDEVAGVVLVDAYTHDLDEKWLTVLPAKAAEEPPALTMGREFITRRLTDKTSNPEALDIAACREQGRVAGRLGDRPLAVVVHAPGWSVDPRLPDDVSKRLDQAYQEIQAQLPRLSTDSSIRVAEKAGHGVHVDEPQLVIDAIREVVAKVKAKGKP